ncbi:MAG TPA: hypothetical protein VKA70_16075 [Blastocatellia bacterium]|nr:hypothetical protein [Blastocatellia bacterium]
MKYDRLIAPVFSAVLFISAAGFAAQDPHQHDQHDRHAEVNKRGDKTMGFSHLKTTHRFRLFEDGGAIEVEVNDAADAESRAKVQKHLNKIAELFSAGDFAMPMAIHDQTPPGVPVMINLKAEIAYKFEATERGGRVRIITKNGDAIAAVHEFLRFQIQDHKTNDPLEVEKRPL